ncbi:hypothetical protein, partial [Xanthomonas perforans]|uniref:hypothetical protein n=1 Tax=Xanthomonas perforans TaxID=442694 RepID=UPI001C1E8777
MQVVATENYVSVMFTNPWMRFQQLSNGNQRTVVLKERVLKPRVKRAQAVFTDNTAILRRPTDRCTWA